MFSRVLILLSLIIPFNLFAQTVAVNDFSRNFGIVLTNKTDSLPVTLNNSGDLDIQIVDLNIYNSAFFVKDTQQVIPAHGDVLFYVYFKPKHNILHNSELVIILEEPHNAYSVDLKGQGRYSDTYYSATENLSQEALKTALYSIVNAGYQQQGYNKARDLMFMTVDNKKVNGQGATSNTLECVYTGRLAVDYISRSDAQTGDNFNTEHTWPQSMGANDEPMQSDMHHLYPTDGSANSSRSNWPFGIATYPLNGVTINAPSKHGANHLYEPRPEHKGRVARSVLYFAIAHKGKTGVNIGFLTSQESILRSWVDSFPANSVDIKRNDDIQFYQKNRNPFVDHPELLERISSISGTASETFNSTLISSHSAVTLKNSTERIIVISNSGNRAVKINSAATTSSQFSVMDVLDSLYPGESMSIRILFTGASNASDSLKISYTGNTAAQLSVYVSGSVTASSVAELKASEFSLYPNPAGNKVTLIRSNNEEAELTIFNPIGEKLLFKEIKGTVIEIDLERFPAGIYFVRINAGNSVKTLSLTKK